MLSVEEAFGDLRDPRSRTSAHDLTEMLVVALGAVPPGADSWAARVKRVLIPPGAQQQRTIGARYDKFNRLVEAITYENNATVADWVYFYDFTGDLNSAQNLVSG